MHRDAEAFEGPVGVQRSEHFHPGIRFRHGERRGDAMGLECRSRLGATSDGYRPLEPLQDRRQGMARLENVEEGGGADSRHEDQEIDLSADQFVAQAQGGGIVVNGHFLEGRSHEGPSATMFDQPGHLLGHTAFE